MKECYVYLMCIVFTFTAIIDGILASTYHGDRIGNILENIRNAVIIDAGSTGSRIYIYDIYIENKSKRTSSKFDKSNIKVHPRIPYKSYKIGDCILRWLKESRYPLDTMEDVQTFPSNSPVYSHFKRIVEYVNGHIVKENRSFTPIFFIGTAGFRMLEDEERRYYIDQINLLLSYFFSQYLFLEGYSARVLDGVEEGIYSFVTIQEMLYVQSKEIGKCIKYDNSVLDYSDYDERLLHISGQVMHDPHKYASIVEIGGASMQVTSPLPKYLVAGDRANDLFYQPVDGILPHYEYILENNIFKMNYDSKTLHLYSKSYLGLGKQLALTNYLLMVYNSTDKEYGEAACLPVGFRALVPDITAPELTIELLEIIPEKFDEHGNMLPYVIGTGNHNLCKKQIDLLLDKLVDVKMPYTIQDNVSIIGLENIFYTLRRLKPVDGFNFVDYTNAEILDELGMKLCPRSIMDLESHFVNGTEREKIQTICFTLNLLAKIFTNVLSLDEKRNIYPKNTILGNPLTWTLGAAILDIPNFLDKTIDELDKKVKPVLVSSN